MSWPVATFAIVLAVLACGWLVYERSRPPARAVAIIATLAAVAALGRDAFAALPDVKPITAFTLVVGYALGPLAGFAVGATGMLASNVMLGQGPYTPWQMAAWGLVGVAGAALGRLSRRRMGRLSLALAAAVCAVAAKEAMNVYEWTVGASHTAAALLVVAGKGLPFDVTDAVASFVFALLFGPELARMLARVRARTEVRFESVGAGPPAAALALIGVAALLLSHPGASALARPAHPDAAAAARGPLAEPLAYLIRAQNGDGGFGAAPGAPSSELYTAWAAMGLAAAGRDPAALRRDGHSVLDALRRGAGGLQGPGDAERTILALRACGAPAASLAGRPLQAEMLRARRPDGSFYDQVNLTAFAIFALRALGHSAHDRALRAAGAWIARQQDGDGGFGFATRGRSSDVDDTAAALQALLDAGTRSGPAIARAVAFLGRSQNPDGGFAQKWGQTSNAQSTAWAAQALIAAGRNIDAMRRGGRSPLGYLQTLIAPGGSVRYSRTSAQTPVWVTAQALAALARRPFPIGPPR